jgi:hypothetical protein
MPINKNGIAGMLIAIQESPVEIFLAALDCPAAAQTPDPPQGQGVTLRPFLGRETADKFRESGMATSRMTIG